MNTEAFVAAYNESRNGANHFVRHPLVRSFQYSDGVQEVAEAGCYWLLDVLATELPAVMRRKGENFAIIETKVGGNGKATTKALGSGDVSIWKRNSDWTDMPEGEWTFFLSDEGERFVLILSSEY